MAVKTKSKADLYKYHRDPRYNPAREIANTEQADTYYNFLLNINGDSKNKINKKIVNHHPRQAKSDFFLGKL